MLSQSSAAQLKPEDFQRLNVTAIVALKTGGDLCCSYTGDIQCDEIIVTVDYAEIALSLRSNHAAAFAADPITWLAPAKFGKEEISKPACFAVSRNSDEQVIIRDWNNEASRGSYRFTINVIYEGKRYVLDPTIVNKEPPPPTGLQNPRAV